MKNCKIGDNCQGNVFRGEFDGIEIGKDFKGNNLNSTSLIKKDGIATKLFKCIGDKIVEIVIGVVVVILGAIPTMCPAS